MTLLSPAFHAYADEHFAARADLLAPIASELEQKLAGVADADEAALLRYWYATLPATDVFDSDFSLFASFAHQARELRAEGPWCRDIPEDVFIHFVASPRVNNEPLTNCWPTFRSALAERLAGHNAYDAVIEANYWCAEMATYQASDGRTLGPLGVLASGDGRCGEESTFLVTALRANGIPARQLYTPWWAHCDDNHAWVEAYTGDGWHYLGACEPEEALDRGWFTAASGRALLVHTRLFSDFACDFEADRAVLEREGSQIIVNLTSSYAPVSTFGVDVALTDGSPAAGVSVRLQLVNEAAWRDVAKLTTDEHGHAEIVLGHGTVRVVAATESLMAETVVNTESAEHVELVLGPVADVIAEGSSWNTIDAHAPADHPAPSAKLSAEQAERGRTRKREADRLRTARVAAMVEDACALAKQGAWDADACLPYFDGAFSNAPEVARFLSVDDGADRAELLSTLTRKDFRDLSADVLEDHIQGARAVHDAAVSYLQAQGAGDDEVHDLYVRYVLSPRAYLEQLSCYRAFISNAFDADAVARFRENPLAVWEYLDSEMSFAAREHVAKLAGSPRGALVSRQTSAATKRTLFVAICRTFGIAARVNPVDLAAEYYWNGNFAAVERAVATRPVYFASDAEPAPGYYRTWSVARLDETASVSGSRALGFEELDFYGRSVENGMCVLDLPDGTYRLVTGTRLPNGDVQEAERTFTVSDDAVEGLSAEAAISLVIREPEVSAMLGDIELDPFTLGGADGADVSPVALALAGSGKGHAAIVSFLEPGMEPTEHLLNELREHADRVAAAGAPLVLVVRDEESLDDPTLSRTLPRLSNVTVAYDDFTELPERLARRTFANPEKLPLTLLVTAADNGEGSAAGALHGRYSTAGYNVGTVDLVLKLIELL